MPCRQTETDLTHVILATPPNGRPGETGLRLTLHRNGILMLINAIYCNTTLKFRVHPTLATDFTAPNPLVLVLGTRQRQYHIVDQPGRAYVGRGTQCGRVA